MGFPREGRYFKQFSQKMWSNDKLPNAIFKGHLSLAKFMIANYGYDEEKLSLYLSANEGHTRSVNLLLQLGLRDDINMSLMSACFNGFTSIAKLLLEHGGDVNCDSNAPLQRAIYGYHTDTVKLLLENGANIHFNDDFPLCWACVKGYISLVKLLLAYGLKPSKRALRLATKRKYLGIIRLLTKV